MGILYRERIKIVIIDDDFVIRQCLKIALLSYFNESYDIQLFSSSNGVEGLGLIYVVEPDVIIIDSTLPEYSGRELIDFLKTNPKFSNKTVVELDDSAKSQLPLESAIYDKRDNSFVDNLIKTIANKYSISQNHPKSLRFKLKTFLVKKTIFWGNIVDQISFKIFNSNNVLQKLINLPAWLITQIISSMFLAILSTITGFIDDSNIEQNEYDKTRFRVKTYPTLVTLIGSALLFLFQISLFVTGGLIVGGNKITSIFADMNPSYDVNFLNSDYDGSKLTVNSDMIELKQIVTTVSVPLENQTPQQSEQQQPEPQQTPEVTPQPEEQSPQPVSGPEVQGIETGNLDPQTTEQTTITYSTENPVITFKDKINFTNLISIVEESSINTKAESMPDQNSNDPKRKPLSAEEIKTRTFPSNTITYQLSPNGTDWYYYGGEAFWEKTSAGFESSNTIQEVNWYLNLYVSQVGNNDLYVRAYLHSDGNTEVTVNSLTVNREVQVIARVNEPVQQIKPPEDKIVLDPANLEPSSYPTSFPLTSTVENAPVSFTNENSETIVNRESVSYPSSFTLPISYPTIEPKKVLLPQPTILSASFANGNKVVDGRIDDVVVPENQLANFKVNIYYTNSTDIKQDANDKLEFIGSSPLYKINFNNEVQYVFELRAPSHSGGYVTSELVYQESASSEKFTSQLSRPLENSTFSVNTTGDQSDVSAGDGSCDVDAGTPGSQCTLRAAIQEANALAGSDNIYFNIPTSDSGYRDYDDPNTASSGDSLGGDDYWTIRPATALPNVTSVVLIDGSTQTASQGDTNTSGPEIEIDLLQVRLELYSTPVVMVVL